MGEIVTPMEIKAALILKGIKMVEVAEKCNVKPTTVSQVIAGRSKSARIQITIAKIIEKEVCEIWPKSWLNKIVIWKNSIESRFFLSPFPRGLVL